MRSIAQGCSLVLAAASLGAQAPAWALARAESWTIYRNDAHGQRVWQAIPYSKMTPAEQWTTLMEQLKQDPSARRTVLHLLAQRSQTAWPEEALKTGDPEVARFLHARGYRQGGADPFAYLGSPDRVDRPWTHGLGLHLDRAGWRFQWIPSPALFTQAATAALPRGLEQAAQPGVLIHLRQLRPGLEKLVALAGGTGSGPTGATGIVPALTQGSRLGFTARHLEPWLKQSSPALEPLASREAWVLHYGPERRGADALQGTLVFIPGDLPARTNLMLALLKLNPLSAGARSRVVPWKGPGAATEVQQVRGSGGVFHLIQRAEGTWISDREAPLRALLFPGPVPTLAERAEWCKVALSAMAPETELSFWVAPRIGADAAFEVQALRRRMLQSQQGTWPNPFVAKAAPRTGALAVSLGAGPTEKLVDAILRVDFPRELPVPSAPAFTNGGQTLTPEQQTAFREATARAQEALRQRTALRQDAQALQACLDLRGAALHWNGWVSAPALSPAEKASLVELARLRREDPWKAMEAQRDGKIAAFGGFGEPGMVPSLAVALPVQPTKRLQAENLLKKLLPRLFAGQNQKQAFGAAELHRIVTSQSFRPAWTIVADHLVMGTDEAAVRAVADGLQGRVPTLADRESRAWGRMELDGARTARELENLLLAYLRSRSGSGWWIGEAVGEDASAAELAFSLGPFLGAVKALGTVQLEWNWTPGGLEGRPR